MSEYKKVIDKVISKSGLSGLEKERLEEEMQAHFEDANKDYLTKGKSEGEVIEDFGDPKLVGQQIRIVKKRWDKIPILGDLIYYPVFRQAIGLGFMQLFSMALIPVTMFSIWATIGDWAVQAVSEGWLMFLVIGLLGLLLLIFIIIRGILAYRTIKYISDVFLLMLLGLLPIVMILAIWIIPQVVIYGIDKIIDFAALFTYVGIYSLIFNTIYLSTYLVCKLVKKYV